MYNNSNNLRVIYAYEQTQEEKGKTRQNKKQYKQHTHVVAHS